MKGAVDYWGIGLLVLWVGGFQVVLDKGQQEDWFESSFIRTFTIVAVLSLFGFLAREFMTRNPVVNLRVFKYRTYSAGVFLMTVVGFVLYGSLVLLPLWLQTLLGYPSLQAGIALAPRGLGSMLGMPIVGALVGKFDPRQNSRDGLGRWRVHLVRILPAESSGRILGFLLASIYPGVRSIHALRAANDHYDESDLA